jgi:DNA-binding XRE family transcriptional regulator
MQPTAFSANKLKAIRREAGISRTALAWACGIAASTVAEYEQGRYTPSMAVVEAIARTIECDVSDFFEEVATDGEA